MESAGNFFNENTYLWVRNWFLKPSSCNAVIHLGIITSIPDHRGKTFSIMGNSEVSPFSGSSYVISTVVNSLPVELTSSFDFFLSLHFSTFSHAQTGVVRQLAYYMTSDTILFKHRSKQPLPYKTPVRLLHLNDLKKKNRNTCLLKRKLSVMKWRTKNAITTHQGFFGY